MRFNCGLSHGQKIERARAQRQAYLDVLTQWHQVLILWPRRFGASSASSGTCVWLEYVWRRVEVSEYSECIGDWKRWGSAQYHPLELGTVEWRLEGEPREG